MYRQEVPNGTLAVAKKSVKSPEKSKVDKKSDSNSYDELVARYTQSSKYYQKKRDLWEENEKLFNAVRADDSDDNGVFTGGDLTTLIIERASRVTAQVQNGVVREIGNTPSAAATVVDLIVQHHIIPNANSGGQFQTKLFQIDMGGDIYGTYPVLYGLNVTEDNAYADFWLVKPQNYYPQVGKVTPFDMQSAQIETTMTVKQLKDIRDRDAKSWNIPNINKLIAELEQGASTNSTTDPNAATYNQKTNYDTSQLSGKGDYAPVIVRTEYQSGSQGHWVTYASEHENIILRDIPNKHKNGKIPIVHKVSIPQFDELYGISTMDRGRSVQKTLDSFNNLGYQNALLNVLPPIKVKTTGVVNSSLKMKPAAPWLMDDLNAVQAFTTGNASTEYFQSSVSSMRAILLNQNGTTDTMTNAKQASDQSFGKTPAAENLRQQKQNARDNLEIRMYDQFYSELMSGLIDVTLNCSTKPIQISLDKDQIASLAKDEQVLKYITVDEKNMTVTINTSKLRDGKFRYVVDSGSSLESDTQTEHARITEIMTNLGAAMPLIQAAEQEGYDFSVGELISRWIASSGTKDYEKIIHKKTDEEIQAEQQQQMRQGVDPMTGQPMPQEAPQEQSQDMGQEMPQETQEPQPQMHPFVNGLLQNPDAAMQHLQNGGY